MARIINITRPGGEAFREQITKKMPLAQRRRFIQPGEIGSLVGTAAKAIALPFQLAETVTGIEAREMTAEAAKMRAEEARAKGQREAAEAPLKAKTEALRQAKLRGEIAKLQLGMPGRMVEAGVAEKLLAEERAFREGREDLAATVVEAEDQAALAMAAKERADYEAAAARAAYEAAVPAVPSARLAEPMVVPPSTRARRDLTVPPGVSGAPLLAQTEEDIARAEAEAEALARAAREARMPRLVQPEITGAPGPGVPLPRQAIAAVEDLKRMPREQVKQVQKALNDRYGTGLAVDGIAGPATQKALADAVAAQVQPQPTPRLELPPEFQVEVPPTVPAELAGMEELAATAARAARGVEEARAEVAEARAAQAAEAGPSPMERMAAAAIASPVAKAEKAVADALSAQATATQKQFDASVLGAMQELPQFDIGKLGAARYRDLLSVGTKAARAAIDLQIAKEKYERESDPAVREALKNTIINRSNLLKAQAEAWEKFGMNPSQYFSYLLTVLKDDVGSRRTYQESLIRDQERVVNRLRDTVAKYETVLVGAGSEEDQIRAFAQAAGLDYEAAAKAYRQKEERLRAAQRWLGTNRPKLKEEEAYLDRLRQELKGMRLGAPSGSGGGTVPVPKKAEPDDKTKRTLDDIYDE